MSHDVSSISDLSSLPVILTFREIMAIFRVSQSTIRRQLARGTFRQLPSYRNPYRWTRDDVIDNVNRRARDDERRRQHEAARRPRQAKATIAKAITPKKKAR